MREDAESSRQLWTTIVKFCDGGQPFPRYKGPWDGRCILRSQDAVPKEQASEMRLSIKEKMHTHRHKPITAGEAQALAPMKHFKDRDNLSDSTGPKSFHKE